MSGRLPVWERLRAPDRRPLEIGPVRRIEVDEALVRDGDLPDLDGATVFDAWARDAGYVLRAARMDDAAILPYQVHAIRLRIEDSDGRLEALLAGAGPVAAAGDLERTACACRGVSVDAVYRAIGGGWSTVDAVKRVTRLGFGPCQGRRCVPWLAERLELEVGDPRAQITPRPPLVPVPVSLLAAYAAEPI